VRETLRQRIWRDRVEVLIGAVAPALDLLLSAGDRVSRTIAPGSSDYYPIRASSEAFEIGSAPGDGKRPPERHAPID
jgi:hypothetical protein